MNKKLIDVIGEKSFDEFYGHTVPAMLRYSILILPDDWEYHATLKTVVYYYDTNSFVQISCAKCSNKYPHKCNAFNFDINAALKIIAEEKEYRGLK